MQPKDYLLDTPLRPKFQGSYNRDFYAVLKRRVDEYFTDSGRPRRGGLTVQIKTAGILVSYVTLYLLLISNRFTPQGTLAIAIFFGLFNVLIVFNIAHDASHNALFKSLRINKLFSYSFNLVGANSYLWNITHNQIHHTYPNIGDFDTDIQQQAPLIRVSPTVPLRWYHQFQHFYAPILYLMYSVFLVFVKDFQDIGILPKKDSRLLEDRKHNTREYIIFLSTKLIYYTVTIVIPFLIIDVTWQQFVFGFLVVHMIMSLFLSLVLIPVHMVDEASFDQVDRDGRINENWFLHVFKNTVDYSRKSRIANFFFGGLNTHLVHHLFPRICHTHYVELSELLRKTAKEFNYDYREVTVIQAIASHFRLLKRMGREELSQA
jgi:linoleoyl-CoA desaturase